MSSESFEIAESKAVDPGRQSMRVDVNSVKHVMEAIMRTATVENKLDFDNASSDYKQQTNDLEIAKEDDAESQGTRHDSLTSRIRMERSNP